MADEPPSNNAAPGGLTLDIIIQDKTWLDDLPDLEAVVRRVVMGALDAPEAWTHVQNPGPAPMELSLCFAGDAFVHQLNLEFRDRDKPTNVLSFPAGDEHPDAAQGVHLGDVVLARGVVVTEAAKQMKAVEDHTAHLVLHGLLHLLGFDHDNAATAEEMEALEVRLLKLFGIQNPYE